MTDLKQVYFLGIGGIGMSGIAEVLLNHGFTVQGSDLKASPITDRLAKQGARIFIGQAAENIEGAQVMVISSAIKPGNPELDAARAAQATLAQERERLTVIDDQFGAPTGADLIADVTAHAIRQVMGAAAQAAWSGIYHLVAAGQTTWHGYAQHVIETAQRLAPEKNWTVQEIVPVPSSAFVTPARRPHNSRLDTHKLQTTWGLQLPDWQRGVDRMLAETVPLA